MHDTVLEQNSYCAKAKLETDNHCGSLVRNELGNQSMRITLEYDLVPAILIRPLTQSMTYEMGLSIFAAMNKLKVAIINSASLSIIPPTEITKR